MLRHFPMIVKNSVRNKRRSILTIISIAASLCLLGVLMALYHAFYFTEASADQALRLLVRNKVSLANPLPVSYLPRIRQVDGVDEAMIFQWFGGTYKDARDPANFFGRFAVEEDKLARIFPEYKLPSDQREAFLAERSACIVGRKTADRHNMKVGDRITIVGDIFPVTLEFVVRGIYDAERDNENLIFHYKYLDESLEEARRGFVGTFSIRMKSPDDATRIAKTIDDMFRNAPIQTKTETEKAFELSFLAFLGNVKAFLLSICGAVTFTILLVAGNTMAMSVRERVKEVGILKTLGFTRGTILSMLMGESVLISVIGGAIGLGLAMGVCALIRQSPSTFADLSRIHLPPAVLAIGLAVAAVIGLVSSVIPAYGASRKSILDALRMTD
ncbi:MAG: FtsX-like permease family protein [Bryobacteraceae bacterium]